MMESWKKGYKTYTSTNFERVNSSHKCRSRRSANRLGIISFKNNPFRCQFIYIWRNNFFVVKSNIIPTFNFQKVIFKKYYNTNFTKMIIIEFENLEKNIWPKSSAKMKIMLGWLESWQWEKFEYDKNTIKIRFKICMMNVMVNKFQHNWSRH